MGIEHRSVVLISGKMFIRLSVFLTIVVFYPCSYAADEWRITPSLTFSESYSDNINLAPSGSEKGAFVTELSPGVSIRRETGKNILDLNYRMQSLYNSGGDDKVDIFHQLQFDSISEIVRNSLFLDLNSSIDQQNATNDERSSNDNLSGDRNRTNVYNYGVSPYWTPHLNGYADGEVRFRYDNLSTDNSDASDAENFDYSIRLNSGRRFSRVTWFVDYNSRYQKRDDGNNVKFRDSLLELRGHINRYYSVFTQVGYSKSDFQATTNESENGFIYTVGAQWKPSNRFRLEAGIGNNSFVTVDVRPFRHMHWVTTYRNDDIGTNTGDVWETVFDYRTKRSIWTASYEENTTTIQNQLANIQSFNVTDEFGNPVFDPVTQQPVQSDLALPGLNDQVQITKNAAISASYRTGKSIFSATLFSNKTTFQVTRTKNDVYGISGTWDWRFARRTAFFIRPAWLQTKREDSKDDRYDLSLGLTRRIPVSVGRRGRLNARIEYRYVNQTSDLQFNEFTENRIMANLLFTY